jgi:hypothetical protein
MRHRSEKCDVKQHPPKPAILLGFSGTPHRDIYSNIYLFIEKYRSKKD